jgi:phospholipase B-like protein
MNFCRFRLARSLASAALILFALAAVVARLLTIGDDQKTQAANSVTETQKNSDDARLAKSYRFERDGWIYVHLEGSPHDIGFQHGFLLAPEIADAFSAVSLDMTHSSNRDWDFFRRAARQMLWPKIDPEYQAEIQGLVEGLQARRVKLDRDDIVAMNAFMELPDYYVPWLNEQTGAAGARKSDTDHCSAFVATGSYTKDHQIVMAHNNWTSYLEGSRWKIIFDIVPQNGFSMLMDGFPGVIASDDDFGVNSAGLMITETTITDFHGWDVNGKPEFVRARKAMQYADSIDSYVKIMLDGNNGGYANDWLLADRKTGEISRFELGLRHSKVWRTTDGYYVGSNFASDPEVLKDETTFDSSNLAASANARHVRWNELMAENKGKIDTLLAESFLADHYDSYTKKTGPNRRTLCGHGDTATEGDPGFVRAPYNPFGAVQGKVTDSKMAGNMSFLARIGHPCGSDFKAQAFLDAHPKYNWQSPALTDMDAGPWSQYHAGEHAPAATMSPALASAGPSAAGR